MIRNIAILSLFIILTSCIKEVDDFGGEFNEEIMVTSFITPFEETISVKVQQTIPVFNNNYSVEIIEDASVKMNNGTDTIELIFNEILQLYTANQQDFPIEELQTYKLIVNALGKQVVGVCTVPEKAILNTNIEYSFEYYENEGDLVFGKGTYNFSWMGTTNYYFPYSKLAYEQYFFKDGEAGENGAFSDLKRNYVELGYPVSIPSSSVNRTDDEYLGLGLSEWAAADSVVYYINSKLIYLLQSDDHYAKYFKTVKAQSNSNGDLTSSGNPFTEPSILYTNIENGLGVFAAYTIDTARVQINDTLVFKP